MGADALNCSSYQQTLSSNISFSLSIVVQSCEQAGCSRLVDLVGRYPSVGAIWKVGRKFICAAEPFRILAAYDLRALASNPPKARTHSIDSLRWRLLMDWESG